MEQFPHFQIVQLVDYLPATADNLVIIPLSWCNLSDDDKNFKTKYM